MSTGSPRFVALTGGVGGAKLALGLAQVLPPEDLLIVVNTGDDFEHFGLTVCPDVDTVTYALAGLSHPQQGWGRCDETWSAMDTLRSLDGEVWFQLGDKDLALHLERTRRLLGGASLSDVTLGLAKQLGVHHNICPMSDHPVRTIVVTHDSALPFQHYFVRDRCEPRVKEFVFEGAASATPSPAFEAALSGARLEGVIICPSNPFVSVAPILAIPKVDAMMRAVSAPIVALSPIIGGAAVKGPTAKMITELGLELSAAGVASFYGDLIDGYVIDIVDSEQKGLLESRGLNVLVTDTLMKDDTEKLRLARETLAFLPAVRRRAAGRRPH